VSGRNRCFRERIVGGLESLSEAGAERAIVDRAANLKQANCRPPSNCAGGFPACPADFHSPGSTPLALRIDTIIKSATIMSLIKMGEMST
jgi:hypothetical protein